jgi:hypothetical protein
LIAWLLVAAIAVVPLAVARVLRYRRDKARARDDRFPFTVGATALAESSVVVRGVLRGGSAETVTKRGGDPRHVRSERLTLEHEGAPVELVGPIHVVRGSRASDGWRRGRRYSVGEGDVVFARGVGKRVTSLYREQGWALEGEPLQLCADVAAARALAMRPHVAAVVVIALGVASWFGLRAVGNRQLAKYPMTGERDERIALRLSEPAVIASMMPGTHDRALAYVYALYRGVVRRDEDNLAARVEIATRLRGRIGKLINPENSWDGWREPTECEAEAFELLDQARYEDVLALGCKSDRVDPPALLALGRFAEIGRRGETREPLIAAAATGAWDVVATGLDTEHKECEALLVRALALGDQGAQLRLRDASPSSPQCAIFAALARPGEERVAALREIAIEVPSYERQYFDLLRADLRWAYDPQYVEEGDAGAGEGFVKLGLAHKLDYSAVQEEQLRRSMLRRVWLSSLAPDSAQDVHAYRMLAAVERGDFALARAELAKSARPELAIVVDVREGKRVSQGAQRDGRYWENQVAASLSDWRVLAPNLLEHAAAVTTNQDAMRRAVRVAVSDSRIDAMYGLMQYVSDAAIVRDISRLAGDTAQATRWQGIVDRHTAAFADPQRATLFAALGF